MQLTHVWLSGLLLQHKIERAFGHPPYVIAPGFGPSLVIGITFLRGFKRPCLILYNRSKRICMLSAVRPLERDNGAI